MTRALTAALVIVLGVLGLAATAVGAPSRSPEPGEVVATRPRPDGSLAVRYRSTSVRGRSVVETATVWLPTGTPTGDVVAWGHPTTGLADDCAPSRAEAEPVPGLDELRAAGHAVVAPDYEGLGSAGDHPYLVGGSEARSVLDALRAARSIAGATGRSAVFGWSQGGHAALFAARLAPSYAPDVRLAGAVAIAPVTDMPGLVDGSTTFARYPGFVSMVAAGYASTYRDLDPTDVVPGDAVRVARRSCSLEAGAALAGTETSTPGATWLRRLRQNDPTTKRLRVPVLLVHGQDDGLLPPAATDEAYDRLCELGTPIRLDRLVGAGHADAMARSVGDVLRWLDGRLAGNRLAGCEARFG